MKTPTIEFQKPSATLIGCESPWASSVKNTYQDLILKPEYQKLKFKFPLGTTWFRIVPALSNSEKDWMLGGHALNYPGGRHAHPRTIKPGARSVFDHAYSWLKAHRPDSLYSKVNKEGYKLLADPVCLFWMVTDLNGKPVSRLILASGYDGSRGGTPGLGHQIWQLTQEKDENDQFVGNPADPDIGMQISVEKRQNPGSRYPGYTLRRGRIPVPMSEMLEKMDAEEAAALTPLEELIHLPDEEEEWTLLGNVIDAETVRKIRDSVDSDVGF